MALRDKISPTDVIIIVSLVKRLLGRNSDIRKFLNQIDEVHEMERLYGALEVFVDLVDGKHPDEVEVSDVASEEPKPTKGKKTLT